MKETRPDDTVEQAMPMAIAPFTYFGDLLDETGDTKSTPESIFRFAMQHASHKVTITRNLVTLSTDDRAATEPVRFIDPEEVNFVIDGEPVADPDKHESKHLDFCSECVRESDCSRFEVLTTPHALERHGGGRATAHYRCTRGHTWTCNWTVPEPT